LSLQKSEMMLTKIDKWFLSLPQVVDLTAIPRFLLFIIIMDHVDVVVIDCFLFFSVKKDRHFMMNGNGIDVSKWLLNCLFLMFGKFLVEY
jgi:hypothetical protein